MRNHALKHTASILGVSILAAAWMVGGPDILAKFGASERLIEMLTLPVAMIAFLWIVSRDKEAMACERRAFRRLIGK
jgi:Na+/pantothenate symporter